MTIGNGYQFQPRISVELGHDIGGPSAGLIFSLAIYDKLTATDLLNGRRVAGTGTIDANGKVGAIGGIRQKLAAATKHRARYFLVPAANCHDLTGVRTATRLIKIDTLHTAVSVLRKLNTNRMARLPQCAG
jgi:PDZ domain-containing protein